MNRILMAGLVGVAALAIGFPAEGVGIVNGPTFTIAVNAPLSGVLRLATDVDTRVSVSVSDGVRLWERSFYDFRASHELPLAGFRAGRTNVISVTVYDKQRTSAVALQTLQFVTAGLPDDFPRIVAIKSVPESMQPGYTLMRLAINGGRKAYQAIVDGDGEVVWYAALQGTALDVRQLGNGDFLVFTATNITELNLAGDTVRTWTAPAGFPIDNHEVLPTGHGTFLYFSTASVAVSNYPTSTTDPNAPTQTAYNLIYDRVVEISATNSALLNSWSLLDMLDPTRVTYLTTLGPSSWDAQHGNGLVEDIRDGAIVASLRHQNALVKFARTGRLVWILAPRAGWGEPWQPYLLTPLGSPFDWSYGQHAPAFTAQGTLMVYDDGNFRASPFDPAIPDENNYSRAVEYAIDETNLTVSQVWDFGRTNELRLYTDKVGSAQPLPDTGNVLVTFGSVRYVDGAPPSTLGVNATMARIREVTHEATPSVVFDLAITEYDNPQASSGDCFAYRSYRIPDLYGHPALPVADLTVNYQNGAHLEFSADPARAYEVQASADLVNWEALGAPIQETPAGIFEFDDVVGAAMQERYYRVVTR